MFDSMRIGRNKHKKHAFIIWVTCRFSFKELECVKKKIVKMADNRFVPGKQVQKQNKLR